MLELEANDREPLRAARQCDGLARQHRNLVNGGGCDAGGREAGGRQAQLPRETPEPGRGEPRPELKPQLGAWLDSDLCPILVPY